MATRPGLQWGFILLSAVVAAVLSIGITLLLFSLLNALNISLTPVCGECPASDLGGIIGCLIACFIVLAILFVIIYLVISVAVTAIIVNLWVPHRRIAHTVLAVLISAPIAIFVLWLIGQINEFFDP